MSKKNQAIGSLDIVRLKNAIELSSQFVREVLYSYKNRPRNQL